MYALAVQHVAVLLAFFRLGQRTDFNPVAHGNFGFVPFFICFVLVALNLDAYVVLAVAALMCRGRDSSIGKQCDVIKQVPQQILQLRRSLLTQSIHERIGSRIRRRFVAILAQYLA